MALTSALAESPHSRHDAAMLTGAQIRAARALIRWSTRELAERAQVGMATVHRAEAVDDVPGMNVRTLTKIKQALEAAGIAFLAPGESRDGGPGVRLR